MAENRSVVTTTALFKLLLKFYDGTPCRKLIRHRYSRTITVRSNTHLCQHQPHWKISNGWASFARRVSKQRKHWSVKEFVTDRNKLLHINFSNYTKRRLRWHFTDLAVTTLTICSGDPAVVKKKLLSFAFCHFWLAIRFQYDCSCGRGPCKKL